MDPVTIGIAAIGIGAISGLAQLWQAERARGASEKRMREIERLYDKIIPPDYDLSISDPPELHQKTLEEPRFQEELQNTKLDMSDMQQVAQYVPTFANLIAEEAPQLLQDTDTTRRGQEAQEAALDEYKNISEGQEDPRFRLLVERAKKRAQGEAQSRQQSLSQNMARRGISGSGLELAAQMGGSVDAMDRLADVEMQAAADSYRNRLEALASGADLGGRLKREDLSQQEYNLGLINDFNRRQTDRRQGMEDTRARGLSEADLYNIKEQQRLAEANRSRRDQISQLHRREDEGERDRSDRLSQLKYGYRLGERDYQNQLSKDKANWMRDEKRYGNTLKSQSYQDKMAQMAGKQGISSSRNQLDNQAAQDRNNAIGGIADSVIKGAMMYGNKKPEGEDYKLGQYSEEDDNDYWKKKKPYNLGLRY